jgi:hypothetical protein
MTKADVEEMVEREYDVMVWRSRDGLDVVSEVRKAQDTEFDSQ